MPKQKAQASPSSARFRASGAAPDASCVAASGYQHQMVSDCEACAWQNQFRGYPSKHHEAVSQDDCIPREVK